MIITRTPYRISFFGGGTDYPDWFRLNGGAVLSTTIDTDADIPLTTPSGVLSRVTVTPYCTTEDEVEPVDAAGVESLAVTVPVALTRGSAENVTVAC
jgi:galactokinase/mevalonate kinase-like predicted kinase